MIRKIYFIVCFVIILLLGACGKKDGESGTLVEKEEELETLVVGNGGNQIDLDSADAPGGEADSEESALEIGKEKSDTIVIVIDWDKIIINDSEYSNIEEVKDQIVKSGCQKVDLQHTDASKETLDKVVDVLKEIEKTLGIHVNYN